MKTYRLVFSDPDGSAPVSTTPTSRELALELFGALAPASIFSPNGAVLDGRLVHERMRLIADEQWPGVVADSERSAAYERDWHPAVPSVPHDGFAVPRVGRRFT